MNTDCQSVGEETCKSYQKGPHISSFLVFNHPISGVTTPSVKQKDTWKWRDQIWIRASRGVFNVVGMGLILSHTQFNQCGSWVLPSLFLSVGTDVWVSHAKTFILLVKYHHVCTTSPWYTPGDTHDQSHIVIVYIYSYIYILRYILSSTITCPLLLTSSANLSLQVAVTPHVVFAEKMWHHLILLGSYPLRLPDFWNATMRTDSKKNMLNYYIYMHNT